MPSVPQMRTDQKIFELQVSVWIIILIDSMLLWWITSLVTRWWRCSTTIFNITWGNCNVISTTWCIGHINHCHPLRTTKKKKKLTKLDNTLSYNISMLLTTNTRELLLGKWNNNNNIIIIKGVGTRKTDINTKMCFVVLPTEQSLMSLWTSSKK